MSPKQFVWIVLKNRRPIILWPVVIAAIVVAALMLQPRTYTAVARFTPSSVGNYGSPLAGLAAQFGVSVPGEGGEESPAFYAALLRSRDLLEGVARDTFTAPSAKPRWPWRAEIVETSPLLDWLEPAEDMPDRKRLDRGVLALTEVTSAKPDQATAIVTLRVTMEHATLAQDVAARLLERVQRFNVEQRSVRAGAERRFIAERLDDARVGLREAEETLERFLARNRSFASSPELQLQYDRLQREAAQRQGVVQTLMQSYETARIDEVRTTPMITVIDQAVQPGLPDRRRLAAKGLFILVSLISFGALFVRLSWEDSAMQSSQQQRDNLTEAIDGELKALPFVGGVLQRVWRAIVR